jgi:hypothetical protein
LADPPTQNQVKYTVEGISMGRFLWMIPVLTYAAIVVLGGIASMPNQTGPAAQSSANKKVYAASIAHKPSPTPGVKSGTTVSR